MSWFKWHKGRQNTGYEKLKLFQFLNIDCYILRYKVGDFIPWHTDPVPGKRHYRLNLTLRSADIGGVLHIVGNTKKLRYKHVIFRSDIQEHAVTEIIKGKRIVLTFGIAL